MKIISLLGLLFALINVQSALTEQLTVKDFKKFCVPMDQATADSRSAADTLEMARCWGYLDGINDGLITAMTMGKGPKLFCFPNNGLALDGSLRMVRDFLNSKKVTDDVPVRGMVLAAYVNYFPCTK